MVCLYVKTSSPLFSVLLFPKKKKNEKEDATTTSTTNFTTYNLRVSQN